MAEVQYHIGYRPKTSMAFAFSYTQGKNPWERKILERYRLSIPQRRWSNMMRNIARRWGTGDAAAKAAFEWMKAWGEFVDLGPKPGPELWY